MGGASYASYAYDAAGNQTSRTYTAGDERWDYVNDSEDNLRRVTKQVASVVWARRNIDTTKAARGWRLCIAMQQV